MRWWSSIQIRTLYQIVLNTNMSVDTPKFWNIHLTLTFIALLAHWFIFLNYVGTSSLYQVLLYKYFQILGNPYVGVQQTMCLLCTPELLTVLLYIRTYICNGIYNYMRSSLFKKYLLITFHAVVQNIACCSAQTMQIWDWLKKVRIIPVSIFKSTVCACAIIWEHWRMWTCTWWRWDSVYLLGPIVGDVVVRKLQTAAWCYRNRLYTSINTWK